MARPRIFVSSTYFDLRVLRADLERFIREMGYEAVMFERGHIPYGSEQALEEYCYREIARVIPPKRAASKSRINTSPAFSAGRVSLLKPSYAFALE